MFYLVSWSYGEEEVFYKFVREEELDKILEDDKNYIITPVYVA
ncbi:MULTISPECIES: hypothetical protein [Carboxydothermus]|uniref:Uncharacterized protein n=2 Tax=Carboxydothermus TaxID=129957 RepID=Q3AFG7_CARHZ|nr:MULTISPECIES: hypothetical protein [Carboxydothermus]ABB15111.1 hypothetical protein CHY_0245 [Carboxydothermus hydrogenoformans Z-2901]NYE57348.1 hypothetical protein [Carboxydothermus ferrireducens DSM 11255]